jgi:hypothetical protein
MRRGGRNIHQKTSTETSLQEVDQLCEASLDRRQIRSRYISRFIDVKIVVSVPLDLAGKQHPMDSTIIRESRNVFCMNARLYERTALRGRSKILWWILFHRDEIGDDYVTRSVIIVVLSRKCLMNHLYFIQTYIVFIKNTLYIHY